MFYYGVCGLGYRGAFWGVFDLSCLLKRILEMLIGRP